MAGTILAVPAIGFTAIYAVLRFPNFAIASHLTIGAFAGWLANVSLGLPAALAVGVAFAAAGVAGVVSDELILKPLRPAGALTTAIAAVALTLVLENVIRFVFGNAVVGGLGSIPGAVVGALTIGVGEELSLLVLAPAYRTVVGFVAILLVLTLRPRGILGERAY